MPFQAGSMTPSDWVRDFIQGQRNYFAELEEAGEALAEAMNAEPQDFAVAARERLAERHRIEVRVVPRDVLPDALRGRGAEVEVLPVYETVIERLSADQVTAVAGADFITFTSASTVRNFLESAGGVDAWTSAGERRPAVVSIGPVTSDELRAQGLRPDFEALEHDIDGLVAALRAAASDMV